MPWIVKDDKEDFVGKWALPHARGARAARRLHDADALPPEGAQVVRDGRIAGRVTSARVSERVGNGDRPRLGRAGPRGGGRRRSRSAIDGALHDGDRHARAVLRPRRSAAPVVTRLAFLSPHEADVDRCLAASPRASGAFTDVSHLGKLEVRGGVPAGRDPDRPGPRARRASTATCAPSATVSPRTGYRVYDMTAALAALEVEGERPDAAPHRARPRRAAGDRLDRARHDRR